MNNNYETAMRYKTVPLSTDEYQRIKDYINGPCRHYILGRIYNSEKTRGYGFGGDIKVFCDQYGYSISSMEKFGSYAIAIDRLQLISSDLVISIIEGNVRLSLVNTILAARMKPDELFEIVRLLSDKSIKISQLFPKQLNKEDKTLPTQSIVAPKIEKQLSIKDTPSYDPDASVSSLTYTIPSWVNAIEKAFINVDLSTISVKARYKLRKEVVLLADTAGAFLDALREER